jgi:SAM-dependent methyltransferase
LEVGSGVGHMSLEFARNGFAVTGLELSEVAARAARETASQNPFPEGFGSLNYVVADFLEWQPETRFDNVCFFGALHHFEDVTGVVRKAKALLNENGRIIVIEPARDWLHESDGALIALIRILLSANDGWYERLPLPQHLSELDNYANECLREYRDATDKSEAAQSPHDNASFAEDMLRRLRETFTEVAIEPGFAFLPRMIGGLRVVSEERTRELADFLYLFDDYAVKHKLMNPGGFMWAGEKR